MNLETERMLLRDFTLEDIDDFLEIFSDSEVMEHVEPAYDREKALGFLTSFCIERKPKGGFEDMSLHKICAHATDGVKSVALMKKLGMTYEGTQRKHCKSHGVWLDLYQYGILAEELTKSWLKE